MNFTSRVELTKLLDGSREEVRAESLGDTDAESALAPSPEEREFFASFVQFGQSCFEASE